MWNWLKRKQKVVPYTKVPYLDFLMYVEGHDAPGVPQSTSRIYVGNSLTFTDEIGPMVKLDFVNPQQIEIRIFAKHRQIGAWASDISKEVS